VVALGAVLTAPGASAAAPPTVTVTPTCGGPTTTLQVSADGLAPSQYFYVVATRPNGDAFYTTASSDRSGHLGAALRVVLGNAPDATVAVVNYRSNVTQAETHYTVGCAVFDADPRRLVEQAGPQRMAIRLGGFQPGQPVELSIPGVPPVAVTPDKGGRFAGTVTFARQPACGRGTITATQRTVDPDPPTPPPDIEFAPTAALSPVAAPAAAALPAGRTRVLSLAIVLYCPRFALAPASLRDSALPGPVTLTGTDWVPLQPVSLTVDGKPLGTVTPSRAGGNFGGPTRLPRLGCGPHRIEALQLIEVDEGTRPPLTLRKQATLTVTCTPAFLTVDPAVTPAGMVTQAAGAGFVPGRTVRLEWIDLDARPLGEAGTAVVGAGGTFLTTCLVLPNSALGTRRLRAVEVPAGGDPVGARTGLADLLVVPSAMDRGRGRFLERG
jgi:hypothetical protein